MNFSLAGRYAGITAKTATGYFFEASENDQRVFSNRW